MRCARRADVEQVPRLIVGRVRGLVQLDQDVDDTVKQAVGSEEPPPEDVPNRD